MINTGNIRNCTIPFPAIQGMVNEHALGKIKLKNIYQSWQGENILQIRDKHEQNPYSLRIGMPSTDKQLKGDAIFFILHYLSYNPMTKNVEMREIIPYRNMEKVYIGQSLDENVYSDCKLFVDGDIVADDLYFKKHEAIRDIPLGKLVMNLIDKTEKLQVEVANLRRQLNNKHIYNQDTVDE